MKGEILLYNAVVLLIFCGLSIIFNLWWIIFISLLFIVINKKEQK